MAVKSQALGGAVLWLFVAAAGHAQPTDSFSRTQQLNANTLRKPDTSTPKVTLSPTAVPPPANALPPVQQPSASALGQQNAVSSRPTPLTANAKVSPPTTATVSATLPAATIDPVKTLVPEVGRPLSHADNPALKAQRRVGAPPAERNCTALIQKPSQPYSPTAVRKFVSDGTVDKSRVLNTATGAHVAIAGFAEDLQVRIEQLRCEKENLKDKLNYLYDLDPSLKPRDERNCTARARDSSDDYFLLRLAEGEDFFGFLLKMIANTQKGSVSYLEDLQTRLEQVQCEDANLKQKLDSHIHKLVMRVEVVSKVSDQSKPTRADNTISSSVLSASANAPRFNATITDPAKASRLTSTTPTIVPSFKIPSAQDAQGKLNPLQPVLNPVPVERNCTALIRGPSKRYADDPGSRWTVNSYRDFGNVLNVIASTRLGIASKAELLQVRVERLRCEDANLKDKLDYLNYRKPNLPTERNCIALIQKPPKQYLLSNPTRWYTEGTPDLGMVLNALTSARENVARDLEDLQIRIEQLRCEDGNVNQKLNRYMERA